MGDLTRQSARAEVLYAEGRPLGVVLSAGLPFRRELARAAKRVLKDSTQVSDVLQEVHLSVWQLLAAAPALDVENLPALLHRLTRWRALNANRATRRQDTVREDSRDDARAGGLDATARELLFDIARVLTPEQYRLWVRAKVHGAARGELAQELGITTKAVDRRLSRISARINRYLGRA